jgi:hypothetical protein
MSQQSGIFIGNKANFSDVPRPSGNNLSYFLNSNDGDSLWAMKSNGSVFPIITGAGILSFKVSLTPAQIKTLNSIPVQAVPAPGIGKSLVLIPTSSYTSLDFVSVAYTSIFLQVKNQFVTNVQMEVPILPAVVSNKRTFFPQSLDNNVADNQGLYITADADSLVGDSPITVYGTYRIITL